MANTGDIVTASGTKFWIGPSKTAAESDSIAEYEAFTWVEVGLVESLGEVGDESSAVTGAVLGDGRTRKAKGARDAGTMAVVCFHDELDVGQIAMSAAEGSSANFTFKMELPDKPNDAGTNTFIYFRGLVMSERLNVGSNDNIVKKTFNLGVNSQLYVDPAVAG